MLLTSCSNNGMTGNEPPEVFIKIGSETFETDLGSYCWDTGNKAICADTAGPVELLEGKEPVKVKPSEKITFVMDYEPKPNEFHVLQISDKGETEVALKDNQITAPSEKGVYYYSYGVWWMDEEKENVSNGDAFYAFALEVD
ncbi:hypothetical protein J9303_14680 [Bacillaceae bacterium Marseille-Q3522]|nr:hypothetical protein [Bacillaceae bacterium Marseille-Q3522]